MTLWPSNQNEWDALAAKLQAARVADMIQALHAGWTPPPYDDEEPPPSPEEEEMLF